MTKIQTDIPFIKMNGLSNDFIIFDLRVLPSSLFFKFTSFLTVEKIRHLSDRYTGIGCDQIIVLQKDKSPYLQQEKRESPCDVLESPCDVLESPCDVFMSIYNADGSEVDACGNATRCVARLLIEETGTDPVTIRTHAGLLRGHAGSTPDRIRVDMGYPKWHWADIPIAKPLDDTNRVCLTRHMPDLLFLHEREDLQTGSLVNMGNPHLVLFPDDKHEKNDRALLKESGSLIECHPFFPQRVNVSLVRICDPQNLILTVWERGSGLTKACGTAACASVVACRRRRLCHPDVTVHVPGGSLQINWTNRNTHVTLQGVSEKEFRGVLSISPMTWSYQRTEND